MAIYTYAAINPDGKQVRGTVEAHDAESARKALEDLHYDVQTVTESSRAGKQQPMPVKEHQSGTAFIFEGKDEQGVLKKGTTHAGTKREAYDKLTHDQRLTLSRLAPIGSPPGHDAELARWNQERSGLATSAKQQSEPARTVAPAASTGTTSDVTKYHPLFSTLRLYAGWLLAWYAFFVALGYYARVRALPWDIPFVSAFSSSGLVFTFVAGIFLFLLLSTLHRALKGSTLSGVFLSVVWVLLVIGVQAL